MLSRPTVDDHPDASAALLAQLRSTVSGRVLTGGPEYAKAVTLFNGAVDIRPAVVVRCAGAADVQAGVRAAREHGVPVSVRGGGHDFWGRALRPGGLVLDLADMREVHVDADRRVVLVGDPDSVFVGTPLPGAATATVSTAG